MSQSYAIYKKKRWGTHYVYVFHGTYYENIVFSKTIKLIGEDQELTIIDGDKKGDTVELKTPRIEISGFTFTNAEGKGQIIALSSKSQLPILSYMIISSPIISLEYMDGMSQIRPSTIVSLLMMGYNLVIQVLNPL